jgi:hypothetical protein
MTSKKKQEKGEGCLNAVALLMALLITFVLWGWLWYAAGHSDGQRYAAEYFSCMDTQTNHFSRFQTMKDEAICEYYAKKHS